MYIRDESYDVTRSKTALGQNGHFCVWAYKYNDLIARVVHEPHQHGVELTVTTPAGVSVSGMWKDQKLRKTLGHTTFLHSVGTLIDIVTQRPNRDTDSHQLGKWVALAPHDVHNQVQVGSIVLVSDPKHQSSEHFNQFVGTCGSTVDAHHGLYSIFDDIDRLYIVESDEIIGIYR